MVRTQARASRAFGVLGLVVDEQRLRRRCAELPQALQEDRRIRLGQPKLRRTEHAVVEQREQRRADRRQVVRSEEHTSELQSLMRNSYAVFCLKKKKYTTTQN